MSVPVGNATRVIAGMRAGFRACYNRELALNPGIAGEVKLVIVVAAQGEVTSVQVSSKPPMPPPVVSCMRARANAAQFAPPEGGKTSKVTLKVTLSPN